MRTIILVLSVFAILLVAQTRAGHKHFIKGLILGRILGVRHHHKKSHHHHHHKSYDDNDDHHQYTKQHHVSNYFVTSLPHCLLEHSFDHSYHNFDDHHSHYGSYGLHKNDYDGGEYGAEHASHTGYGDQHHDQQFDENSSADVDGHAS